MSLKRQHDMMAVFSMASMTDVIFLLLIFFMVTSTFVFPTALDINLPQSTEQVAVKPTTRIYIDAENTLYVSTAGHNDPEVVAPDQLEGLLMMLKAQTPDETVAIYADEIVPYGELVKVLDMGAKSNLKMVLATKAAPASARPSAEGEAETSPTPAER